jgi:hypothetical protein
MAVIHLLAFVDARAFFQRPLRHIFVKNKLPGVLSFFKFKITPQTHATAVMSGLHAALQ